MTTTLHPETSAWEILSEALIKILKINEELRERLGESKPKEPSYLDYLLDKDPRAVYQKRIRDVAPTRQLYGLARAAVRQSGNFSSQIIIFFCHFFANLPNIL